MLELNFTPFPEIITARLLLRRIDKNDAPALLLLRSSETVMKYIDKEREKNISEVEALIQRIDDAIEKNDGINWGICLPGNRDELIGIISFWRIIKQHHRAEVGYLLHPDYWRQGYIQEALKAVIDFGFNTIKLHSIEAHINPNNAASAGLLEKMNFVREAYFKEDYYFRGQFLDTAIYSLLNK